MVYVYLTVRLTSRTEIFFRSVIVIR